MVNKRLQCKHGFTLIEMIGVLAIMATLAAIIAPNVIKQLQSAKQDAEEANLDVLAEGLENYILEYKIIPRSGVGAGTWSTNIATQADLPAIKIYENDMGCSRRYWFDPSTDLDGLTDNSGPYDQNTVVAADISGDATTSTSSAPLNPRAMIISDLSPGCTNNIETPDVDTDADFLAVWDQTGTLTESGTLKIVRKNFSQIFETVTLQASNGSIFTRMTYSNPLSGPNQASILTINENSRIFSVSFSTGGFKPTNPVGGLATLNIGYTAGGDELGVSARTVTDGISSGPITTSYYSANSITVYSDLIISATVVNANSGYMDIEVEYAGEPQYKLEGNSTPTTISINTPGSPEIVSFNVINGTEISFYDQLWTTGGGTGNLLHHVIIKEAESFLYTPGPPAVWGK